jgi:DNA invertase Pin-like site-specific DNA recombinase
MALIPHMDREERDRRIRELRAKRLSYSAIASAVGCHETTVYEVLKPDAKARREALRRARNTSPEGLKRRRLHRAARRLVLEDGHVSMTPIARRLGVDRRVLKRLYDGGQIAGVRVGRVIWLERQALADWLWSRPRCIREGCSRRAIGGGRGCRLHPHDGPRRPRRG